MTIEMMEQCQPANRDTPSNVRDTTLLSAKEFGTWSAETIHCPAGDACIAEREGQRTNAPRKQAGHKTASDYCPIQLENVLLCRRHPHKTFAGHFTEGAGLIHRSLSATSTWVKRLEAILGRPVFERHGRDVIHSEAGRRLLPIAEDVTARLDAALRDVSRRAVSGKLRLGIPDDHGRAKLAEIIAAFTRHHPKFELDVTCALSTEFPDALEKRDA